MGGGTEQIANNNQGLTYNTGSDFSDQLASFQKELKTLENKLTKLNSADKLNISGGEISGDLEIQDNLILNSTAKTESIIPKSDDNYDLGSEDKGWDNAYIHQLWGSSILTIGDGDTSHSLTDTDDLLVSGKLEVDGNTFLDGNTTFGGTIDAGNNLISNLLDPVSAQDAVTKAYYEANTPTGVFSRTGATIAPTTAGDAINFTNSLLTFDSLQTFGGSTLTNLGYLSSASSDIQIQLTGLDTAKEDSLTKGNITAGTGITLTGDITDAVIGSGFTISLPQSIATTATPTFAGLDLNGDIDLNDNLITNIGNAGTNFTAGGGLELNGILSVNSLSDSAFLGGVNIAGSLAAADITTTGNADIGGDLDVTGDTTLTGDVAVSGDTTVTSNSSCFSLQTDQGMYRKFGTLMSPFSESDGICAVAAFWSTPTNGGTETNYCGSTPTITYTTGFTTGDSTRQGDGYLLNFTALTDKVTIADNDNLSFGNGSADSDATIAFWIKFADVTTGKFIIFKDTDHGGGDKNEYYLQILSGRLNVLLSDDSSGGSCRIQTTAALVANTWYHVILSLGTGTGATCAVNRKVYINGVDDTTIVTQDASYVAMEAGTADLWIKSLASGSQMSDLLIMKNVALDANGAKALYFTSRSFLCQ